MMENKTIAAVVTVQSCMIISTAVRSFVIWLVFKLMNELFNLDFLSSHKYVQQQTDTNAAVFFFVFFYSGLFLVLISTKREGWI